MKWMEYMVEYRRLVGMCGEVSGWVEEVRKEVDRMEYRRLVVCGLGRSYTVRKRSISRRKK